MLDRPKLIDLNQFKDTRGTVVEFLRQANFSEITGLEFKQINVTYGEKNAIRGIHYSPTSANLVKAVYCIKGRILDVAINLDENSSDYGSKHFFSLSADDHKVLIIPNGYGHVFQTLDRENIVIYAMTQAFGDYPDLAINPLDKFLDLPWETPTICSERDLNASSFLQLNQMPGSNL